MIVYFHVITGYFYEMLSCSNVFAFLIWFFLILLHYTNSINVCIFSSFNFLFNLFNNIFLKAMFLIFMKWVVFIFHKLAGAQDMLMVSSEWQWSWFVGGEVLPFPCPSSTCPHEDVSVKCWCVGGCPCFCSNLRDRVNLALSAALPAGVLRKKPLISWGSHCIQDLLCRSNGSEHHHWENCGYRHSNPPL